MTVLSRAAVAAMSDDEFTAREAEIVRWVRAGAVDGTEAPPLVRPDGHRWTVAEVDALDVDEWDANEGQILAAVAAGKVERDVDGR